MLKRYLVLSVVTAAFSLPSLVYAAQQNILSVHILNQQTGKPAADVTVTLERKRITAGYNLIPPKQIRMDELRHCGPSKLRLLAITVSYLKPGTISRNKILKVSSLRSPLNFILIK